MPETVESYILKLKERNRQRQKSHHSRLDSKKNIGKRTGKLITSVGGIEDISGLFDSSDSADFDVSRASVTNSIQSKNSAFVKRTPKPPSPPQFSSDEEDEIANTSTQAQQDSDNDDVRLDKTNIQNRSIKIVTDVASQSFFKSYCDQSTQYSSPRRTHTKKPTAHSHRDETFFQPFSDTEIQRSHHKRSRIYNRSSAGESDYASSPSKLESRRIFERILSARKSASKSSSSPYDTLRQKDREIQHTHSEVKKRAGGSSNLKNIPASSNTNSKILKRYTEMISSAKKASRTGEKESLLNRSLTNSMGSLTPRQSSQQSTLRRKLSFKDRQGEAASKPVVTVDSNQDVSAVHPLFELDNHSVVSVSDVIVKTVDSSQAAPSWLYHSANVKEHHPSLLKRRSSGMKRAQNEKSTSKDSSRGRLRSSTVSAKGRSSSRSRSNAKSNLPPRTERSSGFKSKQKLVYNNDSNARADENVNATTSAKKTRGRSSSKKKLDFVSPHSESETSESRERRENKILSTKKARKLPLRVVAYSSSDETDDGQTKSPKNRTPLKSLHNGNSNRQTPKSQQDGSYGNEKPLDNRRKSSRKSHKFYESLVEADILHKMESAERLQRESMSRRTSRKLREKSNQRLVDASSTIRERELKNNASDGSTADFEFSEGEEIENHMHSPLRRSGKSRLYSDSSNSEDEFISEKKSQYLPLKRKNGTETVNSNGELDQNSDPSPPKRKKIDTDHSSKKSVNLKNKKTHEDDHGPSLQSWLDSGVRKEKTPVKLPVNYFKSPHVMQSTRMEERHKKVHPSKRSIGEESYTDNSQTSDHPPLPRVNESSINYTSDDLGRLGQGKSRYSMGFGPPASTPHGLKRTKKRIHDSPHKQDTDDAAIHSEENNNEDEAGFVRINSFSNDSRGSNETYTVRKKQRTKRKSTKPVTGRKSLKYKDRANDEPSNNVFEDVDMPSENIDSTLDVEQQGTKRKSTKPVTGRKSLKYKDRTNDEPSNNVFEDVDMPSENIDSTLDVDPHASRAKSPSITGETSLKEKRKAGRGRPRKNDSRYISKKSTRDPGENEKEGKMRRSMRNASRNNTTIKSTRGVSGERELRSLSRNASKNDTSIKSKQGAGVEDEDNTLVASNNDGTLTAKSRTSPVRVKKVAAKKKKATSVEVSMTNKKTPRKGKKNSKTKEMITVIPRACLALDIVIPNAEEHTGLRRSGRIRTRPLGYRERFVYDEHHRNIIGIERNGDIIPIDSAKDSGKVVHIEPSMIAAKKIIRRKKRVQQNDKKSQKSKPTLKKRNKDETSTNNTSADQHLDTQRGEVFRPQMEWFDNMSESGGTQSTSMTTRGETSRQNTQNITVNASSQSFINRTIPIVDCSTDSVVQVGLTSLFCHDEGLFGTPEVPVFRDEGVCATKGISYKGIGQGKLIIRPLQQKCERVINNAHMCFTLHQGSVDVTISDHTLNVPEGTYFRIPSKNRYSIYNPHKSITAILFFTMIRVPKKKQALPI